MPSAGPYTVPGNIERAVMAIEAAVAKVGTDPVVCDPVFASDLRIILAERRALREACGIARTAFDQEANRRDENAGSMPSRAEPMRNLAEVMAKAMDLSHL